VRVDTQPANTNQHLVAAFSLHRHVFDCVHVSSSYRVDEIDLMFYSQVSVADVTDGVIGSPKV